MATESTQPHPRAREIDAIAKLTPPVVIARYPMQYVIILVRELLIALGAETLPFVHASCPVPQFELEPVFTRPFYPASRCPVSGLENHKHDEENDSSFDSKGRRSTAPVEE